MFCRSYWIWKCVYYILQLLQSIPFATQKKTSCYYSAAHFFKHMYLIHINTLPKKIFVFHYIRLIKQNRKNLSVTWENLSRLRNLLYCSCIHCSQTGIFRLETSVSLWLMPIAMKYLSIFHLKIVPAAKQGKAMVLVKTKSKPKEYPITPHGTLSACKGTITIALRNLFYRGIYKKNGTRYFWGNLTVLSRRN